MKVRFNVRGKELIEPHRSMICRIEISSFGGEESGDIINSTEGEQIQKKKRKRRRDPTNVHTEMNK